MSILSDLEICFKNMKKYISFAKELKVIFNYNKIIIKIKLTCKVLLVFH